MAQNDTNDINRLVGDFMDLQEAWERDPQAFDWNALDGIVRAGAQAYNEGSGPSFQSLALDGVRHSEFHERFFEAMLQAGFDPFKLASAGADSDPIPVIDHAVLAESAETNPSSARIREKLMDLARERFEPLAREAEAGRDPYTLEMFENLRACAESIPEDLLQRVAPELSARGGAPASRGPKEGYLTNAEVQLERSRRPQG